MQNFQIVLENIELVKKHIFLKTLADWITFLYKFLACMMVENKYWAKGA